MAAFIQINIPNDRIIQYDKEQFLKLMQENGIKCENCKNWTWYTNWTKGKGECQHLRTTYQQHDLFVDANFFCADFNPKSNG